MVDKWHDPILTLITDKGELGVNEIAKALDAPLSTVQKYLTTQTYFKKTERRKWDLPENVNADIKSDTLTLMVNSVENSLLILKSQLTDLQQNVDNSLVPVSTLKRGIDALSTPVASKSDKSVDIDKRLIDRDKAAKDSMAVFKHYATKIPDMYKDKLLNLDMVLLAIEKGTEYVNDSFTSEISSLLLGQTDTLSDTVLELLNTYQKDA